MKCSSCGCDLGFDDDPYADPDCPRCLERSILADCDEDRWLDEQAEIRALQESWGCSE